MIGVGVLWSIYSQIIPVASPIFTGYALEIGVSRGDIGTLAALAFLMCLSQPVGFVLSNWFRNKKRFVVGLGLGETIALPLCALAPLLVPARTPWPGCSRFWWWGCSARTRWCRA